MKKWQYKIENDKVIFYRCNLKFPFYERYSYPFPISQENLSILRRIKVTEKLIQQVLSLTAFL